jgi:hypothetical protein
MGHSDSVTLFRQIAHILSCRLLQQLRWRTKKDKTLCAYLLVTTSL